jgi:hypothetical protein
MRAPSLLEHTKFDAGGEAAGLDGGLWLGDRVYFFSPKAGALLETRRPMIRPNRPSTELKISITRILTKL